MTALPLAITGTGMVTGVGRNAPASCAAIRCAIDNFQETRFMDRSGEWIMGCEVVMEQPWRGTTRLLKMAAAAIRESLAGNPRIVPRSTPLLLCLSERERPGRVFDDERQFFVDLQDELNLQFHEKSCIIARGHISVAVALEQAGLLLEEPTSKHIIVAASDSLLVGPTLSHYEAKERLLVETNSNGFIPGEAAAALIIEPAGAGAGNRLLCAGLGFGVEKAHVESEEPLKAEGLTTAIVESLRGAGCDLGDLDFRIADLAGEQYQFKEASLAVLKLLRRRKLEFDVWHPADCIGEVGAAIGLVMISVLKSACEKGYSKGTRILAHLANDDGKRAAMVFNWDAVGSR